MLNLNSIMIGTSQLKVMAEFYEKVFSRPADMVAGDFYGWSVGNTFISVGAHSEVKDKSKDPSRIIINFETTEVKSEFDRIKALGAQVVKEPYGMTQEGGLSDAPDAMWIATLADPDGNYFQLMTPWKS